MTTPIPNAAGERIAGLERAQAVSANDRQLDHLAMTLIIGEWSFCRNFYPIGNVSVSEIMAAIKHDWNFRNPTVEKGLLEAGEHSTRIVLAKYDTDWSDGLLDAEIETVTAHFDDETEEDVAVD